MVPLLCVEFLIFRPQPFKDDVQHLRILVACGARLYLFRFGGPSDLRSFLGSARVIGLSLIASECLFQSYRDFLAVDLDGVARLCVGLVVVFAFRFVTLGFCRFLGPVPSSGLSSARVPQKVGLAVRWLPP